MGTAKFSCGLFLGTWLLLGLLPNMAFANSDMPAGSGTVDDISRNAFGHPLTGVTNDERRQFFVGNSFFKESWVQAPASTTGRDGLGPTFNAVSCAACHTLDGRGMSYREGFEKIRLDLSLLFRLSVKDATGYHDHPVYGEQFNPFGIMGVPGEGLARVEFVTLPGTYPDGAAFELRRPQFYFYDLAFGDFGAGARISPRAAMQLIGLGLIEAIPKDQLQALEDPNDENKDGISGRANRVLNHVTQKTEIGLFGWKAGQPTLLQQNAAAFLGDMGLTTRIFQKQNCPAPQALCQSAVDGGQPEVSDQQLDRLTLYTQLISVPARRNPQDPEILRGENLFRQVQCQTCHTPSFTTSTTAEFAVLRSQVIFPYSDFLLHDMGMGLADHRPEGQANGREWKTPPLWGLGLLQTVSGHQNLLHDGRARGVEEAILWHGGEAEASKNAFMQLQAIDRKALVSFVNSL